MHYSQKMKDKINELQGKNETTAAMLTDLTAYLLSDKFSQDTTVQTKDVLTRIEEIRNHLL